MEIKAVATNVRISPRKARLVADAIRRLSPASALERLEFLTKKGARPLTTVLRSALANAVNNAHLKSEDLTIKSILVDEGLKMKRRDTSHRPGREGLIQKRTSHITVILEG